MTDLAVLVFLAAFFAVAVGFVKACERILGPDVEGQKPDADLAPDEKAAA